MPNHYHLLTVQKGRIDIAVPMQKIGARYTKYFNQKYDYCGHLFQGTYQRKVIETTNHLRKISVYIAENLPEQKRIYPYLFVDQMVTNYHILNFDPKYLEESLGL